MESSTKNEFENLKQYIKTVKPYNRITTLANIVITLTSIDLAFTLILNIIIFLVWPFLPYIITILLGIITLGVLPFANPSLQDDIISDFQSTPFTPFLSPYPLYILLYAIIVKHIFFNVLLYKHLSNKETKFCTNCGDEANGKFCGNCGNKIM